MRRTPISAPPAFVFCFFALALALALPLAAGAQDAAEPAEPAAVAPAEGQGDPPVEPIRLALQGAGHRLVRLAGSEPAVDFPLDASRPPAALAAVVLEATFGSPPASADGIFTARMVDDPRGPRVRIVGDAAQLRTGAYTLRLRIAGEGVEPFEPTVQVSVPAPELRLPARLSVQRVRPLVPLVFGDGETSAEPLVVREVGRFAGLTAVRITQVGPLTLDGRPQVGVIVTPDPAPTLPPGGAATIDYHVEPRHLPAGTLTGQLQLGARELPEPIVIPVEITTRVDARWIVLVVLVGVLLGYVSRQLLGRWRARADALALAAVERRALAAAPGLAADAVFRKTIEQLRVRLDQAVSGRDAAAIADAVAEVRAARTAAKEALEARHAALSARFTDVVGQLTGRPLPTPVAARVDGGLDPIRDALVARQTDRAEALLGALTEGTGLAALRTAWADWRLDARQAVETLGRLGDLAPVDASAAEEALRSLDAEAPFGPLFAAGCAAFAAVHQLAAEVWVAVDGAVEEIAVQLGGSLDPPAAAGLRDVLGRARRALVGGGAPVDALRLLTHDLTTALGNAIGAARPGGATRSLLAERQYRAAVGAAAEVEIPESSVNVRGVAPPVAADARARPPAEPPPGPAGWSRDLTVARLALADPPPAPAFEPASPWKAEVLGSLINAVVISLVAFVVYADDFVGDGKQIISTLLWAYGIDLGAEAVKAQIRRVTPVGGG